MTHQPTTLITGAFARVPGRQLLEVLPRGAALQLVPEPDNPYDEHAIKVFAELTAVGASQLQELTDRLEGTGFDLEDCRNLGLIHLGYVAATDGKPLAKAGLTVGNREFAEAARGRALESPWQGELCFAADGSPMVRLIVKESA
jgi:hypothetical protein